MRRRLSTIALPALLLAPACGPGPVVSDRAEVDPDIAASTPGSGAEDAITLPPIEPIAAAKPAQRSRGATRVPDLPPSDDKPVEIFPAEVTAFMVDRDRCDHFRGEEPYDAERRAFLDASISQLCHGTDARLAALRARHATAPTVITALDGYDDHIEEADARPDLFGFLPTDMQ